MLLWIEQFIDLLSFPPTPSPILLTFCQVNTSAKSINPCLNAKADMDQYFLLLVNFKYAQGPVRLNRFYGCPVMYDLLYTMHYKDALSLILTKHS